MLKELISKIFANNQANVLHLLEKYELHKFISDFSEKIDTLESYDVQKNTIGALASSLLTRINVVLEKIESNEDKERLEYILSEITTVFIYQLLQKIPVYNFAFHRKKLRPKIYHFPKAMEAMFSDFFSEKAHRCLI